MLSLHPAREGVLTNNDWLKRDENFLKKKFQKVLVIKKKGSTFASANTESNARS